MPVYRLRKDLIFPPVELSESDGLLATGGDLSVERLLLAYSKGIFPWYSEGSPILWWSPDPRLVLFPEELKVSRSLRQTLKRNIYTVTFDVAFNRVIRSCAETPRKGERGTWITADMERAYCRLHEKGYAHSVESWYEGRLVGGLYGVALGDAFFGESMFSRRSDASKAAFVTLVRLLKEWDFSVVDCQMTTEHLLRFGAREIPRTEFITILERALSAPTRCGRWTQITA